MTLDFDKPAPVAVSLEEANALIVVLWEVIAELRRENAALRAENAALRLENAELRAENAELRVRVERLEERLRTDSSNSSKPPSSDMAGGGHKKRRRRQPSGRRRGAQKGHPGSFRRLVPVSEADEVIACRPAERCDCGGRVLPGEKPPERRQQFELPKVKPHVTEYQLFTGVCERCGRVHHGQLPNGVPAGMLGPRAMGMVGVLSGKCHLSKRMIEELFFDFFELELSLGVVSRTEGRIAEALAGAVDEAHTYVKNQPVVHADETGHKVAGRRAWMWAAVTELVSVFLICFSRGGKAARELLGEKFAGLLVTDRWSAYNWVAPERRQLCWSHLERDIVKISERSGVAGWLGKQLLEQVGRMWKTWHQFKDGTLDRKGLRAQMAPIREAIERLLDRGKDCPEHQTAGTCKELLKLRAALWTFVEVEGVEPTNNAAYAARGISGVMPRPGLCRVG